MTWVVLRKGMQTDTAVHLLQRTEGSSVLAAIDYCYKQRWTSRSSILVLSTLASLA